MNTPDNNETISITYKNWRGETSERRIQPISIWFGSTKWHTNDQWFLKANDVNKAEERDFAMQDIINWQSDEK